MTGKAAVPGEASEKSTRGLPEHRVAEISSLLRGWAGYFNQGPVTRIYETARRYTERRVRRWLMRRRGQKGPGYRQYPDEDLYQKLGLRPAATTCRPAEREGLRSQVKAGCRKSARPV